MAEEFPKVMDEIVAKHGYTHPRQRYLLFSHDKGILLKENIWSYDTKAKQVKFASTFSLKEAEHIIKDSRFPLVTVAVFPDLENQRASPDACANVGLSRWI